MPPKLVRAVSSSTAVYSSETFNKPLKFQESTMNSSNTQRSRQPEDQSQSRNSLDVTATAGPSSYCQERKMECHGRPCQHCAKDRVDCVEPGGSDNQQPNQLKRKAGELEQGQRVLASLMSSLRNSDDSQTLSLLNLIRSNAPLQELKAFTEEQLSQRRSSELADARLGIQRLQEPKYKITRRRVLDVRQLCDEPTFRVPAKPWTTVTDDDGLVSHFLSLYLTWYHPCFPWIDQDVFINEMRTGDLNSEYCSPFLVNALLAEGCAYSDYAEAYADPSDLSSRGIHFYTEAKRCLELEKRESTIATLQGLEVLSFCSFLLGKDRRGWMYQGQLELAAKDFTRTHPPTTPGTLGKCAGFTLWGLYNTTMASAMAYHKAPLVATPPHKRPPSSHEQDGDGDIWHPYPYHTEGVKTHSACHFSHLCELTLAINDWCSELFGSDEKPAYGKVMSMTKSAYERLQAWEKGLPSCLHVNDNVPVVPQVLVLHMYYHNILITLHGFSRTKEAEAEAGESPISSNTSKRATAIRLSSARRIAQLIDHHRSLWGLNIFSAANTQWITISLFTLLEDLDDPRNRHAFIALAIAAKAASRRWALDKAMLRAVQLTARQMAVSLPPETDALFTDFESLWTAQDRESLSSLYPNFAVSMGAVKDEAVELDKFLAKWDALDISDEK